VVASDLTVRPGPAVTAVLLHPHPAMGGNRFHPVIDALHRGLAVTTLRFDFSSADLATATAEVRAAMAAAPHPAVVLIGYSFGADVALTVAEPTVVGWCLVAPPLRLVEPGELASVHDGRPKRLLVPEADQFSSPVRAASLTADWASTSLVVLPGTDHFLVGAAGRVRAAVEDWLGPLLGSTDLGLS